MKKIILAAFVLASVATQAQKQFTIQGSLNNLQLKVTKVYLNYSSNGTQVSDSAVVVNGKYSFTGSVSEPVLSRLRASYTDTGTKVKMAISFKRDIATLFIENSRIKVTSTDSFANVKVSGSVIHKAYLGLQDQLKDINARSEALNKEYTALYQKKDEEGMKKMEAAFDELSKETKKVYKAFVISNPKSPIALYALKQFAGWDINPEEVDPLFASLSAETKALPSAVEFSEKIEIARKTGIGRFAMEFTQNDTSGLPVSLSSFKGKYLLVDFWASWCGPCRAENPNVVKAFNAYKDKGFHILGVSLDQPTAHDKWMKAIHDDKLTWTHVSDLKYWKNAVAVQYGIQAIPQNLLLDKEGKIIAKNLRGEELAAKLEELLK